MKSTRWTLLTVLMLFVSALSLYAQNVNVTGRVVDKSQALCPARPC